MAEVRETRAGARAIRVPEFLREPLEAAQERLEHFEEEAQRLFKDLVDKGRAPRFSEDARCPARRSGTGRLPPESRGACHGRRHSGRSRRVAGREARAGGRGATDDKGPALSALFGARFAIDQGLPINIRFLWELEEEIGSPHFAAGLKHREGIPRPDSVVVSDTIWIAKGRPAMPYGLRGLLGARLILRTGSKDAHSGVTGGAARNPLAELMEVAQACVNAKTGEVKIPGFYKAVVKPTKEEIRSFLKSGFQIKRFKEAYGFHSLRTNDPAEVMRRIWAAPTFEIHGLTGGYHGPGVKTVVPSHGELKVSMRLVPNQTPEKTFALLKLYVAKLNPDVKVEREGMLHPFKGSFDGPYVECVKRASKAGFGKEPAFIREGGSIGAVVTMQKAWKVPILFLGLSLPEHGYHAPNEYFDWGQASGGMKAFAHYFSELANMGRLG